MAKNKHLMLSMRRRRLGFFFLLRLHCGRSVDPDRVPLTFHIDLFFTHTIRTRSSRIDDTEDPSKLITIMMLLSMT